MKGITIRAARDVLDADRQYALWLRATEGLPFAWRSSLSNARFYAGEAAKVPGARLYADDAHGRLVGYIGTMTPFPWGDDGIAVPTGFPWTDPWNEELARELYDRLVPTIPKLFAAQKPDFLVQRFRSSWTRPLEFVAARGWRPRWRHPILARSNADGPRGERVELRVLTAADLGAVVDLAAQDPTEKTPPTLEALVRRFDRGWLAFERAWIAPGIGAFAFEVRGPWAEVKLFVAAAGSESSLAAALLEAAKVHGTQGSYMTIDEADAAKLGRAASLGFIERDADIYVTKPTAEV